jgi:hypothetical protein
MILLNSNLVVFIIEKIIKQNNNYPIDLIGNNPIDLIEGEVNVDRPYLEFKIIPS